MKYFYLFLLLVTIVSCSHEKTGTGQKVKLDKKEENYSLNDTTINQSVEIKGKVGVPSLEYLQARIINNSIDSIVCEGYIVSLLDGDSCQKLFYKDFVSPFYIFAENEHIIEINMELDKIHYYKNRKYQLSIIYKSSLNNKLSKASFLFSMPEVWKKGNTLIVKPDTIIDH